MADALRDAVAAICDATGLTVQGFATACIVVGVLGLAVAVICVGDARAREERRRWLAEKCAIVEGATPLTPEQFFKLRDGYKGHLQDFDFMGCYVLRNLANGMCYVGQAKHVPQRVNAHFTGKGNGDVYADYRYGNPFEIRMVDVMATSYRRLDDLERDLIAAYDACGRGYNRTHGNK